MRRIQYIKHSIFCIIFLVLISCNKTNWNETFREKDKNPFGTYILYNEARDFLDTDRFIFLDENIYDFLLYEELDTTLTYSYILIKSDAYKISKQGISSLLNFVEKGNTAFIALHNFDKEIKEELEFTTNNLDKTVFKSDKLKELKGTYYLKNSAFKNQPYSFDRNSRRHYFLQYNEKKTIVLGTTKIDGEEVPNFMKIYHGKGALYVHTNPIAFTNYYLLKEQKMYTENVFSYLPKSTIIWDPHIRNSTFNNKRDKRPSIFKFFLQHETLTWFLIVALIGVLLFMLFNARRKQRAIPIKKPLENTTVAFTQTISSLYLKENNHKNLVDKKINYFLAKVRSNYLLDTSNLNKDFIEKLAAKSGNKIYNTKYLINTIIALHKKTECTEEELLVLHKMIEKFFTK